MLPCAGRREGDAIPALSRAYHRLPIPGAAGRRTVAVQWPFLHRFDLAPANVRALCAEQAVASAERRDASVAAVPAHADFRGRKGVSGPRLSAAQVEELAALLLSEAPWRGAVEAGPRVWTAQSVAELIGRSFGAGLVDVVEAELSPLGRRLSGVDPWPAAADPARL